MNQDNLTPKGIIRDIISMRWTLTFFIGKGKEYESLVKFFIEKKYEMSPPIKELVKETGLTYEKLAKYLRKLYEDLMTQDDFIMDTHEVKYQIYAKSPYKGSVVFDLKNLPVVPRVGERVELFYFHECCGTDYFYVKNVRHEFRNGCQTVVIELDQGDYNLFWHLRLDEAIERMEIDWREIFEKTPHQLKEQLDVIPKWYRDK
jgi:hypothetical protein